MSKATAANKQPALTLLPVGPVLLIAISAALSLLAVWQWMELRVLAAGGATVCGISDSVNCGQVWTGTFANRIHSALGMPIAALGLVYGLTALGLSVTLVHRALASKPLSPIISAVRLTAVIGVLTCITMFVASLRTGAVCLMCIATYLLVVAFAVVAVKLLPGALQPADEDVKPAILWAGAFAVIAYALLLYPGLKTSKGPGEGPALPKFQNTAQDPHAGHAHGPGGHGDSPLAQFIEGLQPMEKKALADVLNAYRTATVPPGASQFVGRFQKGPATAPVKIVDFVDIKCGHCRVLEETLAAIASAVPAGSYSVEPHYFPLDAECNKSSPPTHTDGSGTRCAAAKASICLEGTDFYWKAREEMFKEQETLTKERVLEISSKGPLSRPQLEACIADPQTQAKIDDDVAYALKYNIQGTPLVLINGREGHPMGAFLYVMIMTGGNLSAPELRPLLGG